MKSRKVFCLLLSLFLVLGAVIPGTFAVALDTAESESDLVLDSTEPTEEDAESTIEDDEQADVDTEEKTEDSELSEETAPEDSGDAVGDDSGTSAPEDPVTDEDTAEDMNGTGMDVQTEEDSQAQDPAVQTEEGSQHKDDPGIEPLPAVVVEESDEPVSSEIVYTTVSFANVAPFGDPVEGVAD